MWIHERHRQAAAQADKAGSSSKHVRDVSSDPTYHADPLNLSPLADLAQVYPFIGAARRMLPESSRSSTSSEVRLQFFVGKTALHLTRRQHILYAVNASDCH
jgi:hypothetical protein